MTLEFVPWLRTRKHLFCSVSIDFLSLIIIINSFLLQNNVENHKNLMSTLFIFSWIIINYVFGRYHSIKSNKKRSYFFYILVSLICLIIFLGCFSIQCFLFNSLSNNNFNFFELFIKISIYIFVISNIFQLLFKTISLNKSSKKVWIFYGNNKDYEKIKSEFKYEISNLNLILNEDYIYQNKDNSNLYEGLIATNKIYYGTNNRELFRSKNIKIVMLNNWIEEIFQRLPSTFFEEKDIINKNFESVTNIQFKLKRVGDLLLSWILLILSTPFIIISSLIIYLEDRGPIFYSQIRTGYKGKLIKIYKLRTMRINSEKFGPQWAKKNDARITKVGSILRKLRIDELPQLFNIIKGDMSLIGPRPERPEFDKMLEKKIPLYNMKFEMKPGLSGWAQVNYPYGSSVKDSEYKLSYDLYYLKNFSFFLDLTILFKTIRLVFTARGAVPKNES